ncbi:ABC transporter ATP-binding protein [Anaerobacillus sp. MEB173]|uniref:ABC transporter ATP-binding protein n=1 Tax=Anaerobacillus sp. MEB173 TaxID=3383345 RepID=UPI003F938DF7
MSNKSLQFDQVSFTYKNSKKNTNLPVIHNLSFSINDGEFISLLGPSGSGKSTIFRLITGLEQPSAGRVLINNEVITERLGKVGYMPQKDLLLPWRTIIENAILPLELKGTNKKAALEIVRKHMKDFGLEGYENSYPSQLSGGMRQRVGFLRAILSGTNVLLLDEPFSALDAMTRLIMQEWLLEQWQQWRKTVVFITHDVEEAIFLSDKIFLFSEKPLDSYKEFVVPLPRPRAVNDLHTKEVIQLKQCLLEELRKQVKL